MWWWGFLSHHTIEIGGAILSGRYDIVVHCAECLWLVVGTKVMFFFDKERQVNAVLRGTLGKRVDKSRQVLHYLLP